MEKRQAAIHQVKKEKSPRKSMGLKTVRRPPRAIDSWTTDARAPVSTTEAGVGAATGAAPITESEFISWVQGRSSSGETHQECPPEERQVNKTSFRFEGQKKYSKLQNHCTALQDLPKVFSSKVVCSNITSGATYCSAITHK